MSGKLKQLVLLLLLASMAFWQGCASLRNVFVSERSLACENAKRSNQIDAIVFEKLDQLGLAPSETCSDEVFIRRVYLDAAGILPSSQEVRDFLADKSPDKRAKLIDAVLERPEFADYWAMKWSDLLRIKAEFPSNLWPNAAQLYYSWVRSCIARNMPYDQFARLLLTSNGSNFHVAPVNFYRAFQNRSPQQIAENAALVFMGLRLGSSGFTEEQILAFSAFFAKVGYKGTDEWKEEIVYFNPEGKLLDPKTKSPLKPVALDGKAFELSPGDDPRVAFANWLTSPENPWFARNAANRAWFCLMGRGIVEEPDDLRADNLPWSPELLAFLESELKGAKFDMKSLYRLILNSNCYQLSSVPNKWNASDETGFSRYRLRRVEAEPLIDAVCAITGVPERYSSGIPEPFTFLPGDMRATMIADGSISSPFLELFGRPTRNSSYESDRNSSPSVLQAQHMLNSSHIQKKIEQSPSIKALLNSKKGDAYITEELYLRILSRFPTEKEKAAAAAYLSSKKRKPLDSGFDLAWSLFNTREFILKH